MASRGLQYLIDRLGEKDAEEAYRLVIDDYTAHVRKHAEAAKVTNPESAKEAAVLLAVLDAVDADEQKTLTMAVAESLERDRG